AAGQSDGEGEIRRRLRKFHRQTSRGRSLQPGRIHEFGFAKGHFRPAELRHGHSRARTLELKSHAFDARSVERLLRQFIERNRCKIRAAAREDYTRAKQDQNGALLHERLLAGYVLPVQKKRDFTIWKVGDIAELLCARPSARLIKP